MMKRQSNLQKKKKRSEMSDAERVRDFQVKIYRKAKQEPKFRFYVLYDKIRSMHFLGHAYKLVRANKGSAGVDGKTFAEIERYGVGKYLTEIQKELELKTYHPQAVKRVYIPKAKGKQRPLGIPTIKDRIVQMSCKLVVEPIFEADFTDDSYGFRPKRKASDAIKAIKAELVKGATEVYDADLSKYFDTIPHRELLIVFAQRVSDKNVIHLIKMWMKSPIEEDGQLRKSKTGTPQGGVISPLLSNIYLNLLDKIVSRADRIFHQTGIKIIRYADDFILIGKQITEASMEYLADILGRMQLTLNSEKSKLVNPGEEPFTFLGFEFAYHKDLHGRNRKYLNIQPSKKSQSKVREKVRDYLSKNGHQNPAELSEGLNMILRGWLNYFSIKGVSYPAMAKRELRYYLYDRINRYYGRKSQRKSKLYNQRAFEELVRKYKLIDPTKYSTRQPAKA